MSETKQPIGFELSVSGRDDGTIEAMYVQVRNAVVVRTEEIRADTLLADYDASGRLVGLEILSPVKISEIEKLVEQGELRRPFRKFIENSAPRDFVMACGGA